MYKIAVIDDNPLLRQQVINRLSDNYNVCYEADSGEDWLQWIKTASPAERPDIVLMDIEMDSMDGIKATALTKAAFPQLKIAMLTVFEHEDKVLDSILAGADGYLLKDETKVKLFTCIDDIMQGGSYMSAAIARKAMMMLQNQHATPQTTIVHELTKREKETLEWVMEGHSYQYIADKMYVSLSTIKTHIHHIYKKMEVKNKMEAALKMKQLPNIRTH